MIPQFSSQPMQATHRQFNQSCGKKAIVKNKKEQLPLIRLGAFAL